MGTMMTGPQGWLINLLSEVAGDPTAPSAPVFLLAAPRGPVVSPRTLAHAYLRQTLHETGLVYTSGSQRRSILTTFCRTALDLSTLMHARRPDKEQLLLFLASITAQWNEAEQIDHAIQKHSPVKPVLWRKIETLLNDWTRAWTGDPLYGLPLHNGITYIEAQLFARQAIDYFARGQFSLRAAQRRHFLGASQKSMLVQILTAFRCTERAGDSDARRIVLKQSEGLHLPSKLAAELRKRIKLIFETAPSLWILVRPARSSAFRRFLLEQTLLSSLVDGRRSDNDLEFIHQLSRALNISGTQLAHFEAEMAQFYANNRRALDAFSIEQDVTSPGVPIWREVLLQEVRQTGELSALLARAVRGQTLSAEEGKKVRHHLIDLAKTLPALAIFAAPGGLLLLLALAKFLPAHLLPSVFQPNSKREQ